MTFLVLSMKFLDNTNWYLSEKRICGELSPTSLPQKSELHIPLSWRTTPTPWYYLPTLPLFLTGGPSSYRISAASPRLLANYHPKPSRSVQSILITTSSPVVFHRPRRPFMSSPSYPPPPATAFSALPTWQTGRGWCACHFRPSTVPIFHTRGTVGGEVALQQYDHGLLETSVQKIHSHCSPHWPPTPFTYQQNIPKVLP